MSVYNSPWALSIIKLPQTVTSSGEGSYDGQNQRFSTGYYPSKGHHVDKSGLGEGDPPNNGTKTSPVATPNTGSTFPLSSSSQHFKFLITKPSVIALPSDGSTTLGLSPPPDISAPPPTRHEFLPILHSLSDKEANAYLERVGHNRYRCNWALCPQHMFLIDCQESCQWLYCHQELHNSKENARVHVRKVHYGTPDTYSCTVWWATYTSLTPTHSGGPIDCSNGYMDVAPTRHFDEKPMLKGIAK